MLYEIIFTAVIGLLIIFLLLVSKPRSLWKKEGMGLHGPQSRALGYMERMMARAGEQGLIRLSNVLIIRSKLPLTEAILRKALTCLSRKHPLMRMCLGKEKEEREFTYMKEIKDFKVNLEVCSTKDWQGTMEDELLRPYDAEKGPLWRVKFLPQVDYDDGEQDPRYGHLSACVFAFHHVITDGPSYGKMFGEFLSALHEILDNREPTIVPTSLLPPMDAFIDSVEAKSMMDNVKTNLLAFLTSIPMVTQFMFKALSKVPVFVKNLGVEIDRDPKAAIKTCIIPVQMTKEQTSDLLAACKRHKVTVHSAVQTAACVAYSKMSDGGEIKETRKIVSSPTCNLRHLLASDKLTNYFGPYFGAIILTTEVGPNLKFWDMVSTVNGHIQGELKSTGLLRLPYIIANVVNNMDIWDAAQAAREKLPGKRDRDLVFTNLGHLKYLNRDETSNVKLAARYGCSAEHTEGPVFANNLATFNGTLFWTFVYYSNVTSKDQAQMYADLTIETLLNVIKE